MEYYNKQSVCSVNKNWMTGVYKQKYYRWQVVLPGIDLLASSS